MDLEPLWGNSVPLHCRHFLFLEDLSFLMSTFDFAVTASRFLWSSWMWWQILKLRAEGVLGRSWGDQLFLFKPPLFFPNLPSEMACSAAGSPPPFSSLWKHRSWWLRNIFILNFWNNLTLKIPSNQILANHFHSAAVVSGLKERGWRKAHGFSLKLSSLFLFCVVALGSVLAQVGCGF